MGAVEVVRAIAYWCVPPAWRHSSRHDCCFSLPWRFSARALACPSGKPGASLRLAARVHCLPLRDIAKHML